MTTNKITPKELNERLKRNEKVLLLDVRAEEKYQAEHITAPQIENFNIPKTIIFEMEETKEERKFPFQKKQEIIVTCTTGNSAAKCASILSSLDYQVKVLEGGLTAWKEYQKSRKE
ncbi:rhodanese-like domain-containing protein [Bacillus xiapuensis]|uniref:Rhodanese-like domain-containing protein n=1 Tax=Bacillus xiapuensis TaxID=2014075 RepID=A0ABU6N8L3_9BACI|nr:rhodanese-like domain-containing protein [Bacillus xiapuensis]